MTSWGGRDPRILAASCCGVQVQVRQPPQNTGRGAGLSCEASFLQLRGQLRSNEVELRWLGWKYEGFMVVGLD